MRQDYSENEIRQVLADLRMRGECFADRTASDAYAIIYQLNNELLKVNGNPAQGGNDA